MRDFKKERGRGRQYIRMLTGLGSMAALALVAFWAAQGAWGMYQKFADASDADAATEGELTTTQAQYTSVSTTVESLNTPRGLEAAVRERYGVGLPGEREIDIIREEAATSSMDTSHESLWAKVWHAIFVW